ncbi:unnamed protein product [Cuscuta europaea]|uniref:RNase H type-1 domain-containing protein n=1 Tax=Cuscuta europaea TaxID=41803 RepID=A0A9P1A019_CUSEU|nr:unnamed protein product [Cuscuta europaea]
MQAAFESKNEEELCLLITLMWCIWKSRNEVVWKEKQANVEQIINACAAVLNGWRAAQQSATQDSIRQKEDERWERPTEGVIKINVDGAVDANRGMRAWGWLACDEEGRFIRGGCVGKIESISNE